LERGLLQSCLTALIKVSQERSSQHKTEKKIVSLRKKDESNTTSYIFEVERVKGASYVKASNEILAVTLGYESKSEKTTQHGLVQHEATATN